MQSLTRLMYFIWILDKFFTSQIVCLMSAQHRGIEAGRSVNGVSLRKRLGCNPYQKCVMHNVRREIDGDSLHLRRYISAESRHFLTYLEARSEKCARDPEQRSPCSGKLGATASMWRRKFLVNEIVCGAFPEPSRNFLMKWRLLSRLLLALSFFPWHS
jgi:hypothetical protein